MAHAPTTLASSPRTAITPEALEERSRLASRVLTDALLLGVVGDAVLRVNGFGANMAGWSIAIVVALFTLARRRNEPIPTDAKWLAIPAVAIALMFFLRDEEGVTVYNVLALAGTLALLASTFAPGNRLTIATAKVRDVLQSAFSVGISVGFGMLPLVIGDVSYRHVARGRGSAIALSALRATLIAIPLLLIFGGLFASADPVFANILSSIFQIDAEKVASHIILTGVLSWIVGGFLRAAMLADRQPMLASMIPDRTLGLTEVSVALGSLVVLFAAFVTVQLRYFFGGDALVQATAGMSYADYARRGFFELVVVSALVLPVLLSANALLRRDKASAELVYRALAGTLVVLLGVIMYSAVARMRLYQSAYGMSTDRLYATVFMGWLAVVFAWFCATVLRGQDRRFVAGVLVSGWSTLIALNCADPAGFVARSNVARAATGKSFDVWYASRLGGDGAAALAEYLVKQPLTPPPNYAVPRPDSARSHSARVSEADSSRGRTADDFTARCYAARDLLQQWGPSVSSDWRTWNMGRVRARRSVAAHEAALRTIACEHVSNTAGWSPCPEPQLAPTS
jgi:hypothetical protein